MANTNRWGSHINECGSSLQHIHAILNISVNFYVYMHTVSLMPYTHQVKVYKNLSITGKHEAQLLLRSASQPFPGVLCVWYRTCQLFPMKST